MFSRALGYESLLHIVLNCPHFYFNVQRARPEEIGKPEAQRERYSIVLYLYCMCCTLSTLFKEYTGVRTVEV